MIVTILGSSLTQLNILIWFRWFQLHEAVEWRRPSSENWNLELFRNLQPIQVPFLEQYFVVFDGTFARRFFDQVLTEEFINQSSEWGPDYLWCQAAIEWHSERPGCLLVPVVATHEDTRSIVKGDTYEKSGHKIMHAFQAHPVFGKWMGPALEWNNVVGGKAVDQIKNRCHARLSLRQGQTLDLKDCAASLTFNHSMGSA